MKASVLLVAAAGLSTGCSGDILVHVPPPEFSGTGTLILGLHTGSTHVYAAAALSPRVRRVDLDGLPIDKILEVEAVVYPMDLVELGVREGTLTLVPGGRTLPQDNLRRIYAGRVEDGAFSGWQEATGTTQELADLAVREPEPCTRFVAHELTLDHREDLAFAFPLREEYVVLGSLDGKISLVSATEVKPIVRFPPGLPIGAAVHTPPDEVWFGGKDSKLWHGHVVFDPDDEPRIDAAPITTSSIAGHVRFMSGWFNDPYEIYTLTFEGDAHRSINGELKLRHHFEGTSGKAGIETVRRGTTLIARSNEPKVWKLDDDGLSADEPPELHVGITGSSSIEGDGVYFGTGAGAAVYHRDVSGTWTTFQMPPITLDIYSFTKTERGFLAGGLYGLVAEHGSQGWCPEQKVGTGSIREIISIRGGWILAQDNPLSTAATTVTFLEAVE